MSFAISAAAEVEKTVLGICLLEEETNIELIVSLLQAHYFQLDSHQRVFRSIVKLHATEQPVSIVTAIQELAKSGDIESVGHATVASLTEGLPRRWNESAIRNYVDRVKEFWRQRELWRLGEDLTAYAQENDAVASSIVQSVTARLETIVDDCSDEDASISASIVGFLDRFYEGRRLQQSPGLSYGIAELDRHTGGMMPGEQTAVGAVSGVGKTAFMAQGIWATLQAGHAVDAFLLEPTKDQITARIISLMTGVRYGHINKSFKANKSEETLVAQAAGQLAEMPFRMFGRSNLTLDEVLGHARIGIRKFGTRLVCTDYIQRLKIRQTEKDEPTRLRVGRASTALADLVKNTQTHSMLLSQINSGRKGGAMAMPTMFDFRESSQIENDAHTIILLHREYDEQQGNYTNTGAILVPKQRNGTPCNVKAWFDEVPAAWTDTPPMSTQTWHDQERSYV